MISVGTSRNASGVPVMLEKAYPTSEQIFHAPGRSLAQKMADAGYTCFFDGTPGSEHEPQMEYSHSSADLA